MKKKILSLIMAMCMVFGLCLSCPIVTSAANSGSCGDDVTWSIDNNQVLTITGSGKMDDYSYCQPWGGVKKVKITGNVTYVGKSVFNGVKALTSVEIGGSVTKIGNEAFRECTNLKSVKMGDNVAEIGEYAFFGCENLTDAELSKGLKKIGVCAFMLSGIKSVKIPDGVTELDTSIFQTCENLKSVEMHDGITKIGWGVFSYCTSLTSVKIPKNVTYLDECAFAGCSNLESIEFGKNMRYINEYAFDECESLKDVYFNGSSADWECISGGGEKTLAKAKVHFLEAEQNQSASDNNSIKVKLDNKYVEFDVCPQIIDGRTMVPIRAIFEAMGANVTWDSATSTAICKKGLTTVKMTVNSKTMYINNKVQTMDVSPVIIDSRTLAPARFVAEAFGATVAWDENSKTVIITSK